jgi:hypothetical protein
MALAAELRVSDFGAVGDGVHDDGPALRKVFDEASASQEPCTIVFGKDKVYRMEPADEYHGRLMLKEAANVTVEGSNAMLVVHPSNRALGIYRSRNITVRNLQIDYSPLPFTQGTITRIDNQNSYLEFKVQDGYADPRVGDYKDSKTSDSTTFDRKSRKFKTPHARISKVEAMGDHRFGVTYRGKRLNAAEAGDFFVMKVSFPMAESPRNMDAENSKREGEYITTPGPSINLYQSDTVRFENIRSFAAPSMTINSSGSGNVVIQGLEIRRTGDRLVAGCSDGVHLKCNETPPMIRDCHFEGTMDDSIHIKISGDWITKVESPRRVQIRHMDIAWDATNLRTGKRAMIYDHDKKHELATVEIVKYDPIDFRQGWVTLDRDVPEMEKDDSFYLEATGEALIERCRFETQLQRCILTHQPTLIRDCTMQDTMQGIVLGFGQIEGPPSQRLRVENCVFKNLSTRAISNVCPSQDYDQKGDPQLICRNSVFDLPEGVPAFNVVNSKGVELQDNRYLYSNDKPGEEKYISLINSPIRKNSGNRFVNRKEKKREK